MNCEKREALREGNIYCNDDVWLLGVRILFWGPVNDTNDNNGKSLYRREITQTLSYGIETSLMNHCLVNKCLFVLHYRMLQSLPVSNHYGGD